MDTAGIEISITGICQNVSAQVAKVFFKIGELVLFLTGYRFITISINCFFNKKTVPNYIISTPSHIPMDKFLRYT